MQRDYIGYILAVISIVIGTLVSWYYYDLSLQFRSPALILDFMPSTIYDAKRESRIPLKVLKSDGSNLDKSVHVAQHVFWNSGKLAIAASDVLSPIKVSILDKDTEILSAFISEQSRKVASCEIKQDDAKTIVVSFRILEHDDGCSIKLFYAGNQYPKYDISTDIVGVKKVALSSDTVNDIFEKMKKQEFDIYNYLPYIPRAIAFMAFVVCLILYMRTRQLPKRQLYLRTILTLILVGQSMYAADLLIDKSRVINRQAPDTSTWVKVDDNTLTLR